MGFTVDVDIDKKNNIGPKLREGITEYLKKGADRGLAEASNKVPVDRGAGGGLLSQLFTPEVDGERVQWGIRDAPHARPIEFGTDPFRPPIKPLLEWSNRVSGGDGLGFYVALHKIPEEGISEQPFMRPAKEAQINWYRSHSVDAFISRELD